MLPSRRSTARTSRAERSSSTRRRLALNAHRVAAAAGPLQAAVVSAAEAVDMAVEAAASGAGAVAGVEAASAAEAAVEAFAVDPVAATAAIAVIEAIVAAHAEAASAGHLRTRADLAPRAAVNAVTDAPIVTATIGDDRSRNAPGTFPADSVGCR